MDIELLKGREGQAQALASALRDSQRILIGTHEHPDGDALGSSLALFHMLRSWGKDAVVYIPDAAPEFFKYLPGFSRLTTVKPDASTFDAIVLLDYTQLPRTRLKDEFLQHKRAICIDHHYDNSGQGTHSLVIAKAAATAQILMELFLLWKVPLTQDIATCLLTGIFTDTGSFMHDSTSPHILEMAAHLMNKGARLSHIAHETYQKKDLPGLCVWGKALSRIILNEKNEVAISLITPDDMHECQASLDDVAGVVNMLNALPQAKVAMLLVEYESGKIKGSLRSEPHKGMDVSLLAKKLGGGGHKLAAGFEVPGHIVEEDGVWKIKAAV